MPDYKKITDEELVKVIVSGKKELFYHLIKRYEIKLRRYIFTITNRKNEVDDILQNVFLKAYKNLPTFNKNLKFSSWIYRITHNESVNLIGSGFIQKFISMPDWFDIGHKDNIEEEIDNEQIKKQLKNCVEKLGIKYKEPLVLFYYEEKTYEEISDILRIPIGNVGILIHRGKLQVKKICHEKNDR
ncbi:MAG: RNA polymerase sigma factor [Patescibacteria group bacterium]|jgi:RNA polymerase sigma-70 factor (ECF subfamily)